MPARQYYRALISEEILVPEVLRLFPAEDAKRLPNWEVGILSEWGDEDRVINGMIITTSSETARYIVHGLSAEQATDVVAALELALETLQHGVKNGLAYETDHEVQLMERHLLLFRQYASERIG